MELWTYLFLGLFADANEPAYGFFCVSLHFICQGTSSLVNAFSVYYCCKQHECEYPVTLKAIMVILDEISFYQ